MSRTFVGLVLLIWFLCPQFDEVFAQEQALPVQYLISFAGADRHLIDVSATIPADGKQSVEVMMPVWTPGSYLVREYSKNIESISASSPLSAEPLEINKSAKNRWLVANPNGEASIRVDYRVHCREMSVRTNWVEHDFGVLVGAATFITGAELLDRPHHVRFVLPNQWRQSVTAMEPIGDQSNAYRAANFDVLVDSPVLLGNPKISEFTVSEKPHMLVTLNDGDLWDNDRAAEDVKRIVETQHEFWGNVPYEKYLFLNVVGESGGGLEHDNCTLLMTSRWTYGSPERYLGWLGLVSHEFFHTWNVRRLRPRVLSRYDYDSENYFSELWIAEGVTSYFDDLLQVRSGLLSETDYYKRLSRTLQSVELAPGNLAQPLAESSYDAWIKFYRPDANDVNARISYYTKGSLVALVLDAKIRIATDGTQSLQNVMQTMYEKYALDKGGYELQDFRKVVDEVSGEPLSLWLASVVDDTTPLDYQPVLDWYGLKLGEISKTDSVEVENDGPENDEQNKDDDGEVAAKEGMTNEMEQPDGNETMVKLAEAATAKKAKAPYLGASVRDQGGKMIVVQVIRGGPADIAGWNVDDELVAMGDFRATENLLTDHLAQFDIEKPVKTLLSRRGQILHRSLTLVPARGDDWKLSASKEATAEQKQHRRQWLDQPN